MKILRIVVAAVAIGLMLAVSVAAIGSLYNSGYNAGNRQCEAFYAGEEEPESIGPL